MTAAPLPDAHTPGHPVRRAVADVAAGLGQALQLPVWTMAAADTGETLRAVVAIKAQLDALLLSLIAHGDSPAVDLPAHDAAITMAAWLRIHARVAPGEAKKLVGLAHALEQHDPTREALAAGEIPTASAAVIVHAVDALPHTIEAPVRERGEQHLVEHAKSFDTRDLRTLAQRLEHVLDPERADQREADHLARLEAAAERECYTRIHHDQTRGVTDITARVPLLAGLKLQRQLEALLNPKRPDPIPLIEVVNEKGIRISAEERRGQALVQLIDRIPLKNLPQTGGCDPTLVVTMQLDTLLGDLTTALTGNSAGNLAGAKPVLLDTGHRISPTLARRLAAHHGVIPAVLGTKGEVLDLGRKARLATKKQRLALAIQQQGVCCVEDCTTPITWGDAAHLTPWKHGGPTNLTNLVIPCRPHHRMADHPNYTVQQLNPGRIRITRRT